MEDIYINATNNNGILFAYDLDTETVFVSSEKCDEKLKELVNITASSEMYKAIKEANTKNKNRIVMTYSNNDGSVEERTMSNGILFFSENEGWEKRSSLAKDIKIECHFNYDPKSLPVYQNASIISTMNVLKYTTKDSAEIYEFVGKLLEGYSKDKDISDEELEVFVTGYNEAFKDVIDIEIDFSYVWRFRSSITVTEEDIERADKNEESIDNIKMLEIEELKAAKEGNIDRAIELRLLRLETYRHVNIDKIKQYYEDLKRSFYELVGTEDGEERIETYEDEEESYSPELDPQHMFINGVAAVHVTDKAGFLKMKGMLEGSLIRVPVSMEAISYVDYFYVKNRELRMTNDFTKTGADCVLNF